MSSTPADDPHIAAAIARSEARRAVLERVTAHTMTLMDEAMEARGGAETAPEARAATTRVFTQLSRAVRLSIGLEERLDARILALRNGEIGSRAVRSRAPAEPEPDARLAEAEASCPLRDRVQTALWGAIEHTVDDEDEALHRFDRLHERLYESREYDRLDFTDAEGAVRAISADLGVEPEWERWAKEYCRFLNYANKPRPAWRARWRWTPAMAEVRRLRLLADPSRPETVTTLARAGPFKLE